MFLFAVFYYNAKYIEMKWILTKE